jgi:hypothetical protein
MGQLQPAMTESPPVGRVALRRDWLSSLALAFFAAAWILNLVFCPLSDPQSTLKSSLNALTLSAALLAAATQLLRRLPLQNVVAIAVIVALVGAGLFLLDSIVGHGRTAFPGMPAVEASWFGGTRVSPLVFWVALVMSGRDSAEILLRRWRENPGYGFGLIGLAGALTGMTIALTQGGMLSVAVVIAATVIALLFCVPWYIDKRGRRAPAQWESMLIWLLTAAWPIIALILRTR